MRNVLLNLMVILSVFSVQGCWAGETKGEISKDKKSIKSDPIDAKTEPSNRESFSYAQSEIVIDNMPTSEAYWCGSDVVMYQVFTGKYNELSHPVYNGIRWKNIETGKGGIVSANGFIYDCSPNGQWLIFSEKNFSIPESDIHKLSLEEVNKKHDLRLMNITTGKEESLPIGDFRLGRGNAWSDEGGKVFIRSFDSESTVVYKSHIHENLEIYYLPSGYAGNAWLSSDLILAGRYLGGRIKGYGIFNLKAKDGGYQDFIVEDFQLTELSAVGDKFDSNGNWYPLLYEQKSNANSERNILKCHIDNIKLSCKKLLPVSIINSSAYSILPTGDAIHFVANMKDGKHDRKLVRFDTETGEMIGLGVYKEKFPIYMLVKGKFSPDGKWILTHNEKRIAIASMGSYYAMFGGEK